MTLQRLWTRGAIYLVLIAFAVYYSIPFYIMIITGLKPYEDVNVTRMWDLPNGIYLEGIISAWERVSPNFLNSILITVPAALISSFFFHFLHRSTGDRTVAGRAAKRLEEREGRPVRVPREPAPLAGDADETPGPIAATGDAEAPTT